MPSPSAPPSHAVATRISLRLPTTAISVRDREVAAHSSPLSAESAAELLAAGRFEEAAAMYRALLKAADQKEASDVVRLQAGLALCCQERRQWEEAAEHYAAAIARMASATDDRSLKSAARLRNNLAMVQRELGMPAEAEASYGLALAVFAKLPMKDVFDEVTSLHANIAVLRFDAGSSAEAYQSQKKVIELLRNHQRDDQHALAKAERRAGIYAYFLNEGTQAAAHFNRSREYLEGLGMTQSAAFSDVLVNLAAACHQAQDFSRAMTTYEEVAALLMNTRGADDLVLGTVLNNLGCLHLREGEAEKALSALSRSLDISQRNPASDEAAQAELFHNLSLAYSMMGSEQSAAVYRQGAMDLLGRVADDCREKLAVAAATGEGVATNSVQADRAFVRLPVQVSVTRSAGKFVIPLKTETIDWQS